MTRAVAKKGDTALVPAELLDQMAGTQGLEEADSESFAIPFVKVLQKMSPEVDKDAPEFVPNAEPGMFYLSATEFYSSELTVIPVHFRRVFLEWKPRDQGGGFVAEHTVAHGTELLGTCTRDEKNRDMLPNGHELQDTRVHYMLVLDAEGNTTPCVLSAARTQVRGSKEWVSRIANRKLPNGQPAVSYAQVYTLVTVKKSNDQGSWYVFKATPAGLIDKFPEPQRYLDDATGFRELILSGATTIAFEEVTPTTAPIDPGF